VSNNLLSSPNRPHEERGRPNVGARAATAQVYVPAVRRDARIRTTRPIVVRLDAAEGMTRGQGGIALFVINQTQQLPQIRLPPVASVGTV
jgi:hypothetical protein